MSDRELRVTDRRLFTPDGELRDEYKDLEKAPAGPPAGEPGTAAAPGADAAPAPPPVSAPPDARPESPPPADRRPTEPAPAAGRAESSAAPPLDIPLSPGAYGPPSFYDLLGLLAEPVALYLGDARLPDGGSAEDLDMARLYIDLLDVLRSKTAGNLSAQETAALDDVLYRLRMRYVQKQG